MTKGRLWIIPERWEHHIEESSIDCMLRGLSGYELLERIDGDVASLPEGLLRGLGAVPNLRTAYGWPAFQRELWLAARLARERGVLVHFLSGESACYLSPEYKGENRILATYHQSPSVMEDIIPDKSRFALHDGVAVIAPNQVDYFERLCGPGKVHLVPLGVDTDYFTFAPAGQRRVLFVGNWLRDFEMLAASVRQIKAADASVEVVCVTPQVNHALFQNLDVRLLSNIPTPDLLELYRASSALLFPVRDCTGNTALLEAMSLGLPVVANERALAGGYVHPDCALVVADGDAAAMADAALRLVHDAALRARLGADARQRVEERFAWPVITARQREVYAMLGWSG